jgi:PAS domain-containing protein
MPRLATLLLILTTFSTPFARADNCGCGYRELGDNVRQASEGKAAIEVNGVWGFVDARGKMVIAPQFASGGEFSQGLAAMEDRGLEGYIDTSGHWALPPVYYVAWPFVNDVAVVHDAKRQSFGIDRSGQQIIAPQTDVVLSGGWPGKPTPDVKRKVSYQRWSKQGKLLTTFSAVAPEDMLYDYPLQLLLWKQSEGLIPAHSGARDLGYVDLDGRWVIASQFTDAEKFIADHAIAQQGDSSDDTARKGIIDRSGAWVVKPVWSSINADNSLYEARGDARPIKRTEVPPPFVVYDLENGDARSTGWFDDKGAWQQRAGRLELVAPGILGIAESYSNYTDLLNPAGQSILQAAWRATFGDRPLPVFSAKWVTQVTAQRMALVLEWNNESAPETDAARSGAAIFFPKEGKLLRYASASVSDATVQLRSSDKTYDFDALLFRDTGAMLAAAAPVASFGYGKWSAAGVSFARALPQQNKNADADADAETEGYIVIDRKGRRLLPQLFNDEGEFNGGMAIVCTGSYRDKRCGAIDAQGRLQIPMQYTLIYRFEDDGGDYTVAYKNGDHIVLNKSGKEFNWPIEYKGDVSQIDHSNLFWAYKDGQTRLIRGDGKVMKAMDSASFDYIYTLRNSGLFRFSMRQNDDRLYGLIAADGTVLQEPVFSNVDALRYDDSPFLRAQRPGSKDEAILDKQGHALTDFDLTDVNARGDSWLLESHTQKRILLPDGTLIPVPADIDRDYEVLEDGSVLTSTGDNYSYALADAKGRPTSAWYGDMSYLGGNLWEAQGPLGKREVVGADGRVVYNVPAGMYVTGLVQNSAKTRSRLLILQDHDYALLDWQNGERLIALPKDSDRPIAGEDGLVSVSIKEEKQSAFVDMDGNIVTKVAATDLHGLKDGVAVAAVMQRTKKDTDPTRRYGLVNRQGRWVVPARYAAILDSSEGLVWAQTIDGKIVLLNAEGRVLGQRIAQKGKQVWVAGKAK